MPCTYCNSSKEPNANGVCPDCGRAPQSDSTQSSSATSNAAPNAPTAVSEEQQYPVLHWRCTWMLLVFKLINALIMAGVLGGAIWGLRYYDLLDSNKNELLSKWYLYIWIVAMAIPTLYFLLGFISFLYQWFIKRYELRPKDIRLIKGVLNMTTNSTLLEALWGMKLRQNFLQRILGTGKITLFSDDVTAPVLHINDLGSVRKRFKDLIRYQDYALDCSNVKVEKDSISDTSTQVWRYSWRDLIDEFSWGVAITLCLLFIGWFFNFGNPYVRYSLLLIIPVLYWVWLIWTFIDKICCTTYTLNNASLVKESGIFHKKIDVYVLCHIKDCEMSQNLWQRIIGDVGNITLYLKWENKDASDQQQTGSVATTKKDVLHGLAGHKKKYETLKERWLRERHRRQAQS
ncbi:MAG: PH domain-containing protein [Thermoguttaceae bacterium]|nr:PH domain-containing protein [Thermoguttaceae bacterium]MBR6434929.1 PH domain-containing protein [Thermoguttaceae bacterium]